MNKLYDDNDIASIANAIRAKLGTTIRYKVSEMAQAIMRIVGTVPSGTKNITFNGTHDVTEYATAKVNVPSDVYEPDTIVANGIYTPTGHDGFSKIVVDIDDAPTLQNKTVTATSFPMEVVPDTGYYGLNKATVNYTPPALEESKTVSVPYGTSVTVSPSEDYDAMEEVVVTATSPSGTIYIEEVGQYDVTDYSVARVEMQMNLTTLHATHNGLFEPTSSDGFNRVLVSVSPNLEDKVITSNGVYHASTGKDGFSEVTVNVPAPEPELEELVATVNGVYMPSAGKDGFSSVTVDVPAPVMPANLEIVPCGVNERTGTINVANASGYRFIGLFSDSIPSRGEEYTVVAINTSMGASFYDESGILRAVNASRIGSYMNPSFETITADNSVNIKLNSSNYKFSPDIDYYAIVVTE